MPLRLGRGVIIEGTGEGQARRSRSTAAAERREREADDEQDPARRQKAREEGAHRAGSLGQVPAVISGLSSRQLFWSHTGAPNGGIFYLSDS